MKKNPAKPKDANSLHWLVEGLYQEYTDMLLRIDKDIYLMREVHGKDSVVAKFAGVMIQRLGYFEGRFVDVLHPRTEWGANERTRFLQRLPERMGKNGA